MNRVEKFKQKRNTRQKSISAAALLLFLLTGGLLSVDYSNNYLMTGHRGIAFIAMYNKPSSLEIVFMNQSFYVNTQYINRDLNRLKNELHKSFAKQEETSPALRQ